MNPSLEANEELWQDIRKKETFLPDPSDSINLNLSFGPTSRRAMARKIEYLHAIAVDETGSACVTGSTMSKDFPITAGAFNTTYGGAHDAFVVKFLPDGSGLVYGAYLGGAGFDAPTPLSKAKSKPRSTTSNTPSARSERRTIH